tara:strand:+ start:72 stop:716 length:645 start_codon:yes stop_codon:yes gene_type:complete
MKKLTSLISSVLFLTIVSAKADIGIGISGAFHLIDGDGKEITRTSGQVNKGSHNEQAAVPELFIESINDDGVAIGISYIPTRDMGSESRSDSNADGDTGTYTAKAELDDVIKIYSDIPTGKSFYGDMYVHLGIQHVTVTTLESLNSGETYPDEDLFGYTIGLGTKGDLPYGNAYYKTEISYTNFEDFEVDGTAGNSIEADLQDFAARVSIGYKF